MGLLPHPFLEPLLEGGKPQEEVLRLPDFRSGAAKAAAGLEEFIGVQRFSALLALISPSLRKSTVGTGALYIAVGQETPTGGAVGEWHGSWINIALVQKGAQDVVDHLPVVRSAGGGEEVEGYP